MFLKLKANIGLATYELETQVTFSVAYQQVPSNIISQCSSHVDNLVLIISCSDLVGL